jgi:hypothetical protein
MHPLRLNPEEGPISGVFLEKKGLLREALAHEAELAKMIPGYDLFEGNMTGFEKVLRYSPPLDPVLAGLARLDNVSA